MSDRDDSAQVDPPMSGKTIAMMIGALNHQLRVAGMPGTYADSIRRSIANGTIPANIGEQMQDSLKELDAWDLRLGYKLLECAVVL